MIDAYLDRDDYGDKAGAYATQDIGDAFVAAVDGDYDNVIGFRSPGWRTCWAG
jgi:predicted house-cleaning NTP pyrophosphatase (Maf/HAM1 superfamily)